MGAWIEIGGVGRMFGMVVVAPFMGAWIEINMYTFRLDV